MLLNLFFLKYPQLVFLKKIIIILTFFSYTVFTGTFININWSSMSRVGKNKTFTIKKLIQPELVHNTKPP